MPVVLLLITKALPTSGFKAGPLTFQKGVVDLSVGSPVTIHGSDLEQLCAWGRGVRNTHLIVELGEVGWMEVSILNVNGYPYKVPLDGHLLVSNLWPQGGNRVRSKWNGKRPG